MVSYEVAISHLVQEVPQVHAHLEGFAIEHNRFGRI
jgi:hypothetical protein